MTTTYFVYMDIQIYFARASLCGENLFLLISKTKIMDDDKDNAIDFLCQLVKSRAEKHLDNLVWRKVIKSWVFILLYILA